MVKNINYEAGESIGSVTAIPTFILGIQGWLDSMKGEKSIPDIRVEGLKNSCSALEKKEALLVESRYETVRKEGMAALAKIITCRNKEKSVPEKSNGKSPYDIRSDAKRDAERESAKQGAEEAEKKLLEIKETLVHADMVLTERIRKTREEALNVKIAAYVKGVRKGKMTDYMPDLHFEDDAYRIYTDKHKKTDDMIFSAVDKLTEEAI